MKIEPYQLAFIKDLARAKVGGHSEEEVVWFLLQMAIVHLAETSYVQKYLETRKLLRK